MPTRHVIHAFWDDELLALSQKALQLLGEDAVNAAVERANVRVLVSGAAEDAPIEQVSKYRDAVKAELRRLVVVH